MKQSDGWLQGSHGTVYYRRWVEAAPIRRIVLVIHGYAEHGGRYAHVAEALTAVGAAVYAGDHAGHGRSDGERALITDFERAVDDLRRLAGIARAEHPGVPLVLVGHSMGGLLAGRFAQRWPEEVAGVAFCGAVIGDWAWARRVLAQPELPYIEFDPAALSRDPAVGVAYASDPLVYHGQYKRGLLEAEVAALDRFQADIGRLDMPVLFLHGSEDPFVPHERSLQAVRDMATDDVTIRTYQGARHEVLNESNRAEVIADLTAWIGRFSPPGAAEHGASPPEEHVGALFPGRESARAAVEQLHRAGVVDEAFEAAVGGGGSHLFEEDISSEVAHAVTRGIAVGIPIGAAVGAMFIPVIAAVAGTTVGIAGGVAGAMAGAFVGAYFGAFFGFAARSPAMAEELAWELTRVARGEVLVIVEDHGRRHQVEEILTTNDGRLIHPTRHAA